MRAISAISGRSKRTAVLVFAVLIGLALVGWAAARQIRSPAQVAADTAAPKPSPITVPVVRRTLSTEVIVRAEGIVPNASERVSTSPPAMLVDVPG